ncbi:GntR family transcriptional regulator [bacterium]|nr:MAG: GntR family transcriptional regulator [bacterium]
MFLVTTERRGDSSEWARIAEDLRRDIAEGKLAPGDKIGSETDLAQRYRVSRMTVHRALSELRDAGLVVRRPRAGTVVAGRVPSPEPAVRTVALVFYNAHVYPQANYLRGIQAALSDDDRAVLMDTRDDPRREAELLRRAAEEADAIFLYPTCAAENTDLLIEVSSRLPVVCLDRVPMGIPLDAVVSDNYDASRKVLQVLIDRGHRRIAHFTDSQLAVSTVQERLAAHRDALCEIGVDPRPLERMFPTSYGWDFSMFVTAIGDALHLLRSGPEPVTAAFCLHDQYMAATLAACESMGLRVPEDFEIASFHDSPSLPVANLDAVERIVPRIFEIGRMAAERLRERRRNPEAAPRVTSVASDILAARPSGTVRILA